MYLYHCQDTILILDDTVGSQPIEIKPTQIGGRNKANKASVLKFSLN